VAIILIEHDMKVVMGISDRVVVLDHGREDRRGYAEGHPAGPRGDRGVPGEGPSTPCMIADCGLLIAE